MRLRLKLLKIGFFFVGMLIMQSFTADQDFRYEETSDGAYKLVVHIDGEDFESLSREFFYRIHADETNLDVEVFQKALKGYLVLNNRGELNNERFLTIVDYSKSSKEKRLFVIDLEEKTVKYELLTAHGKNSGGEYARYFSNTYNSRKSCLGFLTTGEIYNGRHRLSLKLHGLEYGYNNNAYNRGIVIHGAYYVDERYVEAGQSIGRSFGCPAVSQTINKQLVSDISDGSCVFFYYPYQRYLQNSTVLNSDTYIPMEQLKALVE